MEFLAECEIEYAQGCYIGEPEPFRDLVSPTGIDPTARLGAKQTSSPLPLPRQHQPVALHPNNE